MTSDWPQTTLGDRFPLVYGKGLRAKDRNRQGDVDVFGSNGPFDKHDAPLTAGPTVVVGRKGSVGEVHFSKEACWVGDTAFFVEEGPDYDIRYVFYLMRWLPLDDMNTDAAVPGLNRKNAHRLTIPDVPIVEQRAIAEVLGSLDDHVLLVDETNRSLHALGEVLLARELDDAGFSPSQMISSEDYLSLGDVLAVLESGSRPKGGVGGIADGVPSVGAESITRIGEFDFGKTKFVPREFFERMRRGHAESLDVLLYKDGGSPGQFIPHVSMSGYGFPFEEFAVNDHVYRLRGSGPYHQPFLYFWLSTPLATDDMAGKGTGAAQPGLNQTNLKSVPVPDLSHEALVRLEEQLAPICEAILRSAAEAKTVGQLRDTLLPELLSGRLRVDHPERLLEGVA